MDLPFANASLFSVRGRPVCGPALARPSPFPETRSAATHAIPGDPRFEEPSAREYALVLGPVLALYACYRLARLYLLYRRCRGARRRV